MKEENKLNKLFRWGVPLILATLYLINPLNEAMAQTNTSRSSHIGTFEGETAFSLSSETGILPSIEIETKDVYGNANHYESEEGNLVISNSEDGATVKKAILKGQTLMNLLSRNSITIADRSVKWGSLIHSSLPTKTHLFVAHVENNTLDSSIKIMGNDAKGNAIWVASNFIQAGKTGYVKAKITPTVELLSIGFYNDTLKSGSATFKVMILEYQTGMENWNIPYFEGTQSVKAPVLTISNEDGSETVEITLEEDLVLRSNGVVYDELNLMTGKFTQRLNENNEVLDEEAVRYVKVNSTHTFDSIKEADISVKGEINQTIASINVPTEALTFSLNPNLESDQQFIAPDFSISNESRAPIGVELKSFEQVTNVLNDVLPNQYDSWEDLNKKQSEDIALAVIPQASDRWISLNEGAYYVANTVNQTLGTIKGNSVVDFKFSALHGQAFSEPLTPQYKLTFVFEL